MPELAEEHGMQTPINIFLNPLEESDETKEALEKYNKVTMKKDAMESFVAFSFEMMVLKKG